MVRCNTVPRTRTRTVGQIVRANVFTRFNALLGAMLAVILVVGPIQDALFGFVLIANARHRDRAGAPREADARSAHRAHRAEGARRSRRRGPGGLAVDRVVLDDVLDLAPGGRWSWTARWCVPTGWSWTNHS